ncbi:hypothetical protein TWF679_001303 [Orbilia oligospora]|uniref:Uncharacterized protein n=1 Tax=Orbilia oligospora TaxID=2813651 RepID=A0A8H8UVQ7_ORBOL|nr:hypothetical protein TWF679_001303 [Orbilia oligospora]
MSASSVLLNTLLPKEGVGKRVDRYHNAAALHQYTEESHSVAYCSTRTYKCRSGIDQNLFRQLQQESRHIWSVVEL